MNRLNKAFFISLCLAAAVIGSSRDAASDLKDQTAQSRTAEPAAAAPSPSTPLSPGFVLEARPDDSSDLVLKKAALRLFKSYQVTLGLLNSCKEATDEAGQAMGAFNSRNGNTVGQAMKTIRAQGGITADIKTALEAEVAKALLNGPGDCRAFVKAVNDGQYDLYKNPSLAEDYKLIRSR